MASLSTRWAKKSVTDLTAYRGEGLTVSTFGKGKKMVGTAGFEPATTTPPVWCATRLRYAPNGRNSTSIGDANLT